MKMVKECLPKLEQYFRRYLHQGFSTFTKLRAKFTLAYILFSKLILSGPF